MVYFAYGFPLAFRTGCERAGENVVYSSFGGSDYLVVVTSSAVQIWSGGQHRLKLGELTRDGGSLAEEGPNLCACWCPSRRVVAVATEFGCLNYYGIHISQEILWHCPGGHQARRVSVYLQNSARADREPGGSGGERVAALCGDARSLLAVLADGRLLALSWQGKVRGAAHPLASSAEGSRPARYHRLRRASSSASPQPHSLAPPAAPVTPRRGLSSASEAWESPAGNGLLQEPGLLPRGDSLPAPALAPAEQVAVLAADYEPRAALLAVVLADGRAALVQLPAQGGLGGVEHARLVRWVHTPARPATGAVAAAIQPGGQLLALGLAHGRVAIHSIASLLKLRRDPRHGADAGTPLRALPPQQGVDVATPLPSFPQRHALDAGTPLLSFHSAGANGSGRPPEPLRVLSLAEWGYSSGASGAAHVVSWSPDGRVVAVGYARRGLAVWTPSGCRVMCSLRQAAQGPLPGVTGGGAGPSRDTSADGEPAAAAAGRLGSAGAGSLLQSPSVLNPQHALALDPGILEGGIAALAWSPHGYSLLSADLGSAAQLVEVAFARSLHGHHRVSEGRRAAADAELGAAGASATGCFVLQAADRLLLVLESPAAGAASAGLLAAADEGAAGHPRPELSLQHVRVPQQYIEHAYPLQHIAVSGDGRDVAAAGARGLALYSCRAQRWRVFGDARQERRIRAHALCWLQTGVVVVCAAVYEGNDAAVAAAAAAALSGKGATAARAPSAPALLLYPRHHLDAASMLARQPLPQLPLAMDAAGQYIVLAFAPLEIRVLRAAPRGGKAPALTLTAVRELSILGMGSPLQQLALLPELAGGAAAAPPGSGDGAPPAQGAAGPGGEGQRLLGERAEQGPAHCVLLRAGGVMSVLDLDQGYETVLSDEIETFWLPATVGPGPGPGPAASASLGLSRAGSSLSLLAAADGDDSVEPAANEAASGSGRSSGGGPSTLHGSGGGGGGGGGAVEMPWWTYGARGMQLWFPSSLADRLTAASQAMSPSAAAGAEGGVNRTDPELEFDREVYPVGVSLAEVSIVGVTQRMVRNPAFPPAAPSSLSFHPHPESQPVLPCLLRRLLEQGRAADSLELATRHSGGASFARSLEWLLFTTLEADADAAREAVRATSASPSAPPPHRVRFLPVAAPPPPPPLAPGPRPPKPAGGRRLAHAGPLLVAAARLVQHFPQCAEIVVSVARKTDAALWPALFAAAGSPAALCEGLLKGGALQSAACCLVVVDHVEGPARAHSLALRLIRAALEARAFELAADLLRYLLPPGSNDLSDVLDPGAAGAGADTAAAAPTERQQQQQRQQQPLPGLGVSWLWSTLTGDIEPVLAAGRGGGGAMPPPRPVPVLDAPALPLGFVEGSTPVTTAWRVVGRHAWNLLDAGALRDLAALGLALDPLHGGLPALLSSTAGEAAAAAAHMSPSAAAVASALFVASNEFAAAEAEGEAAAAAAAEAAGALQVVCTAAGCVNHAVALALILGDTAEVESFSGRYPDVWEALTELISNDVHLCGFAAALAAPGTPLMR